MQQLSGLDNSFLVMEAGGQLGHVGSLIFFDAAGLDGRNFKDVLRSTIEDRLHLLGPYRRRLVEVPLDLDRPFWIEDPDFDMDFHFRHIAVPPPGDEHQVSELVSRIHARALDRKRPLWEIYVIEGLANNRIALYTKIHHCTIDGVSGAQMTQVLLDQDPEGDVIPLPEEGWHPDRIPRTSEMMARGVAGLVTQPGESREPRTARHADCGKATKHRWRWRAPSASTAFRWLEGFSARRDPRSMPTGSRKRPPPRPLCNRSITPHRRFSFFSMSLPRFKEVKRTLGVHTERHGHGGLCWSHS